MEDIERQKYVTKILSFSQEPEREASFARSQTWDKAIGDDEKKSYGDISAQPRAEFRNLLHSGSASSVSECLVLHSSVAHGCVMHNHAYLKDWWNCLDFFMEGGREGGREGGERVTFSRERPDAYTIGYVEHRMMSDSEVDVSEWKLLKWRKSLLW